MSQALQEASCSDAGPSSGQIFLELLVTEVPNHAPHCAWLEPKSGHVDEALSKLESLRTLPRAVHVEPQLLRPRGWKRGT